MDNKLSHFSSLKTKVKRASALIKALQEIDGGCWKNAVEVNDKAVNLYGYRGDMRDTKADIVIRRKDIGGSSNDIGFAKQKDGTYEAVISDYDRHHHDDKWLDHLNQLYAKNVVREIADLNGFTFEYTEQNGEISVTCERD